MGRQGRERQSEREAKEFKCKEKVLHTSVDECVCAWEDARVSAKLYACLCEWLCVCVCVCILCPVWDFMEMTVKLRRNWTLVTLMNVACACEFRRVCVRVWQRVRTGVEMQSNGNC